METLKGLVIQPSWDTVLKPFYAIKTSIFGGAQDPADWKKLIIPSAVVLTSTAAVVFAMSEKLRARKHDNIPTFAEEQLTYYGGHLAGLAQANESYLLWLLKANQEANFPKLSCMLTPGPRRWILLQDPKLVKFVYDTHFNDIGKGDNLPQEYSEVLGEGIFASDGDAWKLQRKCMF